MKMFILQLSVDRNGKVLSCDDEAAVIFQYEASDLIGLDLRSLIPSVDLVKDTGQYVKVLLDGFRFSEIILRFKV